MTRPRTPDPLAPEEALATAERPPRRLRAAFAAAALLFFATPLALGLLGVSGGRVAGEPAAAEPSLSDGWGVFDSGTRWFALHLPGRRRAVSANNWISREVFGTKPVYGVTTADRSLPSGGVEPKPPEDPNRTGGAERGHAPTFEGLQGWTFLQADLDRNCHPPITAAAALRRWRALVGAIRASGRKVVLLLAPEKSTIYPELLGSHAINGGCALRNKAGLWSRIEAVRDPDIVALRRPLLERKRASRQQLYLRVNSHWNDYGAVELVRRALERVGGRVRLRAEDLVEGRARYASDLSRFQGETSYGTTATLTVRRHGDAEPFVRAAGGATAVSTVAEPRAPMLPGRTLFLGDSFGDAPLAMLRHYATPLVSANWDGLDQAGLARLVKRSDTVIVEAVERSFLTVPSGPLLSRLRLLRDLGDGRDRAVPRQ
jgi:hypothetical protein